MKGIAIVTVLAVVGATFMFMTATPATRNLEEEYQQYLAKYRKSYNNADEFNFRFELFKDNLKTIEEHNAKGDTFTMAMNQFGDMTSLEFSNYLGYNPIREKYPAAPVTGQAPASVDWRTKNAVNPVQNQGMCGSCWAFSATGAVEGSYAISSGNLLKFSEQQLVDCSGDEGNMGCNGGLMDSAFKYLLTHKFCLEGDYAYTAKDGTCKYDSCKDKAVQAITNFQDVEHNDAQALREALALGPVAVAVEADRSPFQFYSSGIVTSESCGTNLDHGILAVGYGTENGVDYFIVKNSWGSSWGESGYIRIGATSTHDEGICGILADESYTIS